MLSRKLAAFSILVSSLLVSGGGSALAEAPTITYDKIRNLEIKEITWNTPVEYDFQPLPPKEDRISPRAIPDETVYEVDRNETYRVKGTTFELINRGTLPDSLSRSVSRKTFLTFKGSATYEAKVNWGLIEGKAGVTAEVSFGTDTTETTTMNWNIAPKSITVIEYGSKAVRSVGNLVTYSGKNVKKKSYVDTKYSYMEYSDKSQRDL
ncbi:hypothetical protein NST23_23850 [Brevibacillus sp. FSL K6-0770]|uniref:hypothetical protein n=1 Tax=Brevibacillus sp. FSL K6-0770 TaxID=2954673 RepID=UPI0030FAA0DC